MSHRGENGVAVVPVNACDFPRNSREDGNGQVKIPVVVKVTPGGSSQADRRQSGGDLGEGLAEGASLQGRPEQHDDQGTQTSSAHSSITSETRAEINPKPQYHFGLLQTGIGNSTLLRDSSRRLPPHWTP